MSDFSRSQDFRENFEKNFSYIKGFMRNVTRFASRPALSEPATGRKWTYRELNLDVNRLCSALHEDGVSNGDVVMYMLRNCPEFVFCYLAPQKLGAVNCPINFRQAAGETALNIEDSAPKVFIYDSKFTELALHALELSEHKPERIICVDTTGIGSVPEGHVLYSDYTRYMYDGEPATDAECDIYEESTRFYTSGTTNRPKGVPIFSLGEVLSAHDVIMHFPLSPIDRTLNMTPWFHRGGLHSGGPCPTLYVGGEVIALLEFSPETVLKLTEEHKITFLIGAPATLTYLAKAQDRINADLSSLKGIVTMGSPLDKATCLYFQKTLTPNIFNGYGTTETFWNSFLRPYELPDHAGSCGRSCTDDDVRVVKVYPDHRAEPDELVAQDNTEIGEVIIFSPSKSGYLYHNNPEMTTKKFYKGYLYTGDMGTWDEEAYVTISGRKDDMIISASENIYPAQLEGVLNEHPKVSESCVVGVADPIRGQAVAAYIVASDDSLTIREISNYMKKHEMVSPYKRPKYYCICQSLPHTASGKLRHCELRAQADSDLAKGILIRS